MKQVRPKVKASTTGSGLAGAIVTLVVAITGWEPEPETAAALVTVVGSAAALIAGYRKADRPKAR